MSVKVYAHFTDRDLTLPICIEDPSIVSVGAFLDAILSQASIPQDEFSEFGIYPSLGCNGVGGLPTSSFIPSLSRQSFIASFLPITARSLPPDFFIAKQDHSSSGALKSSVQKKGELSYYYAHKNRVVSREESVPQPVSVAAVEIPKKPNKKQSPFGTDVTKYISITDYIFEGGHDRHEKKDVKVHVKLPGIKDEVRKQSVSSFSS
jgi:hypothetical protein